MITTAFTIEGTYDNQVPVYAWLPATEPTAVLLISHGMAEYAERYASIAALLVQENIAVYAYDQAGHGKAVAGLQDQGIVTDDWFNKQVADINLLVAHLRTLHPLKKIFLLGHSMGSFLSQRYFQLHGQHINGLILSASNGKQDPLMPAGISLAWLEMKLFGPRHRSKLIDKLSFGRFNAAFKTNRTSHDWLSRDTAEVDKYVQNPRCGFICSAQFFYHFFKGIKDCFSPENITGVPKNIPVLAFAGDRDPVGLEGKGFMQLVNKWKQAGVQDLQFHLYENGRHEMMNEVNRNEVLTDLITWIKNHL